MTQREEKAAQRSRLLSLRAALSPSERAERDKTLCEILLSSPLLWRASCVALYAAVRGEIDLAPVAKALAEKGIPLAYPITERGGVMHFRLAAPSELVPGRYAIPEPKGDAPEARLDGHAVCLVPAVGYDRDGYRVGYGGGYYDRFLAGFSGISIGITDKPLDFLLPREAHDRAVDYLLTVNGMQKLSLDM
jgi:5-formyltetrahydrofolate cyclo-ligase